MSDLVTLTELDCDSFDTALGSLSALTKIEAPELSRRLLTVPLDAFETRSADMGVHDATAWLWRRVVGSDEARPIPDVVYWFHATRVSRDTDFRDGLLPLPAAAARLEQLFGPSRRSRAFKEKMEHRASWGPFGHLVREAAFSPMQNHFFDAPEAVVDLGYDLDAYRRATVPCLVKFRARDGREDVAELALLYCYFATWGQTADWDCSTTWSGEGKAVQREDIIRIDFLEGASF
jgi:hypothetical protein